jgi:hypothetical protein
MNKSPVNHIVTIVIGVVLWVIFGILMVNALSESPNLKDKDATVLAGELRFIFGIGVLLSLVCSSYWYYYGSQEKTAGEMPVAKRKWRMLFFFQLILAIVLTVVIIIMNMSQEMESKWFIIYFGLISVLTFILFWAATFLMSPRTVKFVPFGK